MIGICTQLNNLDQNVQCSYNVVWNQFKKLSMKLSETERQFLFHDTAMNVYQLEKI